MSRLSPALAQYTELFKEHKSLIDSNSAAPLNALRPAALEALERRGLPRAGSENYETTDLEALLTPDYGLNPARVPLDVNPAESFRCGVPRLSTWLFLTVNDLPAETDRSRDDLPEGIEVGSLRDFARREPELVARYYGQAADIDNPIVALNTLLAQDGFFLRVRRGIRLERPLQLVNILQSAMPLMAVRRILVVMEEDSEAQLLLCDHTQNPDIHMASLQTVEIFAGRGSRFDLYDLEESTARTTRLNAIYLRQEEGSNVLIDGVTLFNGSTRNEYHCRFCAPHSTLRLLGMAIEDGHRRIDTYSRVDHAVGHCHTEELFKYVADDSSTANFTGMVYVAPGAVKTEAYQSSRNIVGSGDARVYAKPQLEIYNDDVKCSHGSAVGQLDPMQVFYMRTRGIPEEEARLLLKQAFMADVIEGVRLPLLRDRLTQLVERRFNGVDAGCSSCSLCAPAE